MLISDENIYDDENHLVTSYFDEWAEGFIKVYFPKITATEFVLLRARLSDQISVRIATVNSLRRANNLCPMALDEAYDYYLNNLPVFDPKTQEIDFDAYQQTTKSLAKKEREFASHKPVRVSYFFDDENEIENDNIQSSKQKMDMINKILAGTENPKLSRDDTNKITSNLMKLAMQRHIR